MIAAEASLDHSQIFRSRCPPMASFEARVALDCPIDDLFDFLVRPANLPGIMPETTPLEVIDAPERLSEGSQLVVTLGGLGPPQELTYEVTDWDPPHSFSERMISGPLAAWDHVRTLKQVGESPGALVELIEEICFEPPEGLAGLILTEPVLMTSLERGFAHRHRRLREILETSE